MWVYALVRRFRGHIVVAALLVLSAAMQVGCGDRETVLVIEKPTEVRSIEQGPSSPESAGATVQPGKVIATLKAGEAARVVGLYHGSDSDGFHVRLEGGMEGIIIAGDTFKVVAR
jgi:hypothetical protein